MFKNKSKMKKIYINPEWEEIEVQTMGVLASSENMDVKEEIITQQDEFLAPELFDDDVDW